jgi:sugar O-acyltransferase (sialic acid O-acetyltransferase NeuD family)
MEKVIIFGGKGTAVVVAEQIYDAQIKHNSKIEFLGFAFDDDSFGSDINGFPVLAKTTKVYEKYKKYNDIKFIFQMYRQDILKERIMLKESYEIPDDRYCTFIHPTCTISRSAHIGLGSVILSNSVVNPNAKIGKFCTLQTNCLVGHDANIGDYNFIAAHAIVSNLTMGNRNFIGINASTNNFINIGDDCFIAMGSNVIKNVESGSKVMGNPAKPFFTKIGKF